MVPSVKHLQHLQPLYFLHLYKKIQPPYCQALTSSIFHDSILIHAARGMKWTTSTFVSLRNFPVQRSHPTVEAASHLLNNIQHVAQAAPKGRKGAPSPPLPDLPCIPGCQVSTKALCLEHRGGSNAAFRDPPSSSLASSEGSPSCAS